MQAFMGVHGSMVPFVPRSIADALLDHYGNGTELGDAFRDNLAITEVAVTPEHGDAFIGWYANEVWVEQLLNAADNDCIHLDDPDCQQLTFPADRDPDCTYENF